MLSVCHLALLRFILRFIISIVQVPRRKEEIITIRIKHRLLFFLISLLSLIGIKNLFKSTSPTLHKSHSTKNIRKNWIFIISEGDGIARVSAIKRQP